MRQRGILLGVVLMALLAGCQAVRTSDPVEKGQALHPDLQKGPSVQLVTPPQPDDIRLSLTSPVRLNGSTQSAKLSVTDKALKLVLTSGITWEIQNPVERTDDGSLLPLPYGNEDHLLVKIFDGRIWYAWVLVVNGDRIAVAFETRADDDVTVFQGKVKVGNRKYKPDGGYVVSSGLFGYNSQTGHYESTRP